MSDNTLEVGQVRVGWLYPGEVEEGKGIPATLVREGHRVQALISAGGFYSSGSVSRWGMERIFLVMTRNEKIINMMFLKICISSIITV